MANFKPLKNYILFCIDKFIKIHNLKGPFLDVGCGVGDVSLYLSQRGWQGKAIDISKEAVKIAKDTLKDSNHITVLETSIENINEKYNTILLLDIIEHVKSDNELLLKASQILDKNGYIIITVPSNKNEWGWDDEYYGHYRRYDLNNIIEKLRIVGLTPIEKWDFTYPIFWLMRRFYLLIKNPPKSSTLLTKKQKTLVSSQRNAWDIPLISTLVSKGNRLWEVYYRYQYKYFRYAIKSGHEMIILARKIKY